MVALGEVGRPPGRLGVQPWSGLHVAVAFVEVCRHRGVSGQGDIQRRERRQAGARSVGLAARMEREVKKRWQPQIRAKARRQAATAGGIVVDTRARFGYTAAPGSTDDSRLRHLTVALPPECAARLFDAREQGATGRQLREIAAEGLQEIYFKDRGRRAEGLLIEFTDVQHIEFDL
ncbi:telomere-protecting terminal protein Tpg [Streptomyces sp. MUM 178J]|uniref:telomere-protecting terminal protein Tpg n=1 Tax=Streptomyces sp. MUM 178J TaxID=2791991 RepID=UPI001F047455|nr:XRE family transcriptional regulator [Streptomyces sp. MUM 178J]WRQ77986.1 XRE family transcriptional regulator [Streptomyces sp. MUM 178J]